MKQYLFVLEIGEPVNVRESFEFDVAAGLASESRDDAARAKAFVLRDQELERHRGHLAAEVTSGLFKQIFYP